MNLSRHSFSIPEYKLLNKNLNFCPSPGKYNKTKLKSDIDDFTRKIKLKAHFGSTNEASNPNQDGINNKKEFYIKKHSTWQPNESHHTVKTFIDALTNDIEKLPDTPNNRKHNLTKKELQALKDLQNRDDIVITNADKGGAVVIQDVESYIKEAKRQLNDETSYEKCQHDLTQKHLKQVNDTIDSFQKSQLLSEKTFKMLKSTKVKTPKFYTLPKIHKKDYP